MRKELGENFVGLFTDPGAVHTGYVIVAIGPRNFEILTAGEVNGLEASADLVNMAVTGFGATLWIYEGFRLYAHKAQVKVNDELEEVQTIGAMRYASRPYHQSLHISKQFASEIKIPPFEDDRLRVMGLDYRKHMPSNHTRDAFRHFLCYWCFKLKRGYPSIQGLKGVVAVAH
jgi:hypothetical protein